MAERKLKDKKISDIINPRLIQARSDISVRRAVELMRENQSSYLVLADDKRVVGVFTETDIVQHLLAQNADDQRPVRDLMTKDPVVLRPDDTVGRAVDLMASEDVYHIPLVNEKQELSGVLSVRTLVRFLSEFYPAEVYNIPPNPHQVMRTQEGG